MTLVLAALAGLLSGRLVWFLLRPTFGHEVFQRENFRGRSLPTAVGVVMPVALVLVEGGRALLGGHAELTTSRALVVLAVVGFGLLGLVDDLGGVGEATGFRGHLVALGRGRLTTGGLKLAGGAAVALLVCGPVDGGRTSMLVADAALVALAANLGNLLDRRPGRVIKVGAVAFAVLAALVARRSVLTDVAVVVGAGLALLLDDLHEHLMVGDVGANVLGGAVGLGVVLTTSRPTRLVVLVVAAGLNLASEAVSFTRVIEAVPPLRALDRWGRRA